MLPKIALLGRPNVGKSTLFNRLIRSNRAITHDRPGVTRDRMEGVVRSRSGRSFTLIDTGGVTLDSHHSVADGPEGLRGFEAEILQQTQAAMDEASVFCLVVDGRDGLMPFDEHLASFVRRAGKPTLLVVNKVDGMEHEDTMLAEFHALGRRNGKYRARNAVFQPPEHRIADSRRQPLYHALDHAADGVLLRLRLRDLRLHGRSRLVRDGRERLFVDRRVKRRIVRYRADRHDPRPHPDALPCQHLQAEPAGNA